MNTKNKDINIIDEILSSSEVRKITGKSRATIYRWSKSGLFPKPRSMGNGHNMWFKSDVIKWFEQLHNNGVE